MAGCKSFGDAALILTVCEKEPKEGYNLTVTTNEVRICGNSAAGAFWGLQTLQQLVNEYGADALPCCVIEDAPMLSERGFYHDITRGKLPTLDTLKYLVDQLALFKINSLQLYVEHAFAFKEYEGIVSPENQMTAEEMRELDDYCYERFIELIPSLATFGHLYHLLQSDRYRHLCELEDYQPTKPWLLERMAHHTIDAYNPESIALIRSLINQYAPLFRSGRFNICCDETFDLCTGRNKDKDKAQAYFSFVTKIIACVREHGRQVMMCGDVFLRHHPELLEQLPDDVVVLNWDYAARPNEERVAAIARLGQTQILCPGTTSWNYMIPAIDVAVANITSMARFARQYGAIGILNTNWGDYGHIGSLSPALYLMVIGAAVSWSPNVAIDEQFDCSVALQLYGDRTGKSIALLRRQSHCEDGSPWTVLCKWIAERREIPYTSADLQERIAACDQFQMEWECLKKDGAISAELAKEMCLAGRTAAIFCGMLLSILEQTDCLPEPFETWLKDYTQAWLAVNKESELPSITALMQSMLLLK